MYSRFRGYLFLSALLFAVLAAIAWFQSRPTQKISAASPTTAAQTPHKEGETLAKPLAVASGEISANWRTDIGVPVLCYHQIVTTEQYRERPTPYAVTVDEFRAQMEYLATNNFYTISSDDLLAYVKGEKSLDFSDGKRPIVLTFDDGNNDFVNYAQPILNKHKFKGVLFIYPTYIIARKKRALTWTQVQEVSKAGHAIESHTMWHPMLSTMNEKEQLGQFVDSQKTIQKRAGVRVSQLAYPFGIYNSETIPLLQRAGYTAAYTIFHGANHVGENPYLLKRFLVTKGDNGKSFAQKTLAHSLPFKNVDSEPGAIINSEKTLSFQIPKGLAVNNLKVRVYSTAQAFRYNAQTGNLVVDFKPSKKRLSILEVLYKENGIEYRANALFNHKTGNAPQQKTQKKAKSKKRRHNA